MLAKDAKVVTQKAIEASEEYNELMRKIIDASGKGKYEVTLDHYRLSPELDIHLTELGYRIFEYGYVKNVSTNISWKH